MAKYNRKDEETPEEDMDDEGEEITLTFEQLPEAQDWKDGETYILTVKQVSSDESGATFEIISADSEDDEESEEESGDEEE